MMSPLARMMMSSDRQGPYFRKDLDKAERATGFIGEGSPQSSTASYARAMRASANTGTYGRDDVIFVSAEGSRVKRRPAIVNGIPQGVYRNIDAAAAAGVEFVVDVPADRRRTYNVGEREVAGYLLRIGYIETRPGRFTPGSGATTVRRKASGIPGVPLPL